MKLATIGASVLRDVSPGEKLMVPDEALVRSALGDNFTIARHAEIVASDLSFKYKAVVILHNLLCEDTGAVIEDEDHYEWVGKVVTWLREAPVGEAIFFTKGNGDVTNYHKGMIANLSRSGIKAKQLTAAVFYDGKPQYKGVFLWRTE